MAIAHQLRNDVRRENYDYLGEYVYLARLTKRVNIAYRPMIVEEGDRWRIPKGPMKQFRELHHVSAAFILRDVLIEETPTSYIVKPVVR